MAAFSNTNVGQTPPNILHPLWGYSPTSMVFTCLKPTTEPSTTISKLTHFHKGNRGG